VTDDTARDLINKLDQLLNEQTKTNAILETIAALLDEQVHRPPKPPKAPGPFLEGVA
jgi:hypothetical protein